jgi:hypothetical protein
MKYPSSKTLEEYKDMSCDTDISGIIQFFPQFEEPYESLLKGFKEIKDKKLEDFLKESENMSLEEGEGVIIRPMWGHGNSPLFHYGDSVISFLEALWNYKSKITNENKTDKSVLQHQKNLMESFKAIELYALKHSEAASNKLMEYTKYLTAQFTESIKRFDENKMRRYYNIPRSLKLKFQKDGSTSYMEEVDNAQPLLEELSEALDCTIEILQNTEQLTTGKKVTKRKSRGIEIIPRFNS